MKPAKDSAHALVIITNDCCEEHTPTIFSSSQATRVARYERRAAIIASPL